MKARILSVLVFAFLLIGCNKSNPVSPSFSASGNWLGVITTQQNPDTYSIDLIEDMNGQIHGTGTVDGGGSLKVIGWCSYPNIDFTVSGTWPDGSQYSSALFKGTISDNNHMSGNFGYDQMTFTRR